ncbi:MAG: type II and III secretion system protein family protein [Tepidisphaeraceae bacterium]
MTTKFQSATPAAKDRTSSPRLNAPAPRRALLAAAAVLFTVGGYAITRGPAPTPIAVPTVSVTVPTRSAAPVVDAKAHSIYGMAAAFCNDTQIAGLTHREDYSFGDAMQFLNIGQKKPTDPFAPESAAPLPIDIAKVTAKTEASVVTVAAPTTKPAAPAESKIVLAGLDEKGKVSINTGRQSVVKTSVAVARLSVANPDIADALATDATTLLVTARKPGTTQVIVWDDAGHSQTVDITVSTDLGSLVDQIKKSIPDSQIDVSEVNGGIALRGRVKSATQAKQAEELAGMYGKVLNFIEIAGGQRVSVKVQFAEVSRSVSTDLGVNWGFSDGRQVFGMNLGQLSPLSFSANSATGNIGGLGIPTPGSAATLFGRGLLGSNEFAYFIQALKNNNLMRMLASPYIVTNSGEMGTIFAGGEFAVPVPSSNGGSPTIEYREFGIRLKCTPAVLGNGNVKMKVEYEVSALDSSAGTDVLGVRVPGLRKRSGEQVVELGEGQTLPLGGLFDSETVTSVNKVPGLGDLPVLGALFRSTSFQRRETELVVLLTPELAGAFNPDQVPALPGDGWRSPSELEQLIMGDVGGDHQADQMRDWNKSPSQRGASKTDKVGPDGKVVAADTTHDRGYASFSPLADVKTPAQVAAGQTPPLFVGDAGYAPIEPTSDTATAGAGQ